MLQQPILWPDGTVLASLVREAQRDAPGALDALLAALRPALVGFFSRRLASEFAEDLTQSALLRVTGALGRIDPERADAYLATVARNLLRTAYRRRAIDAHRRVDADLDDVPVDSAGADARIEYEELILAVHRVVAGKLPPELAEIIRALLRGDTPAEIAARQAVSPVTVRTRLMRARAILRKELSSYLESAHERLPSSIAGDNHLSRMTL
jgi:RNA polymerase sigma factor (sigma-70 family)